MKKLLLSTVLLLIFGLSYSQVKVYEGKEVIPTYRKGLMLKARCFIPAVAYRAQPDTCILSCPNQPE